MDTSRHITVEQAIEAVRNGRMVIVVDDEDRENEGDLTMAADLVTPEAVNFMARLGRGLICLSLTEDKVAELGLGMMTQDNRSLRATAFTVSIDARQGITTGISARERAHTILTAVAPGASGAELVTPGHVFPLKGRRGGVLVRSGHTEAAIDLARLAGREPAGVICEIMREDGEMARLPDLERFAAAHDLGIVRIADLIQYRLSRELLVRRLSETTVRPRGPGLTAEYRAYVYGTEVEETQYLALVLGDVPLRPELPTLVRVQSARLARDVFGITENGAASPPPAAWLKMIEDEGRGVFLYVVPRDRLDVGAGLGVALGHVPVTSGPAPEPRLTAKPAVAPPGEPGTPLRDFGLGAQVLAHLGVRAVRLLTNQPRRIAGVEGYGLHVIECVPSRPPAVVVPLREENR
jgi:3,4-dihydroxy 2-butanone 4-phosphate synthase / GTP cyclohydrolase II